MRNLLIERFKIKFHMEEQPVQAFVLTSLKPKLKKADPANRTGCHEGLAGPRREKTRGSPIRQRVDC